MVNVGYASKFNSEVVTMMNASFNRLHWPLLTFFLWREKITKLGFDGVTSKDFREADFGSAHIKLYIKALLIAKTPLLTVQENLYARAKYNLTPHGRKIADIMWTAINYYMKSYTGKTVEEEARILKETLSIDVDEKEIDEEEKFLKELEDENHKVEEARKKKAGIVDTPNGPMIDLNMVKVK